MSKSFLSRTLESDVFAIVRNATETRPLTAREVSVELVKLPAWSHHFKPGELPAYSADHDIWRKVKGVLRDLHKRNLIARGRQTGDGFLYHGKPSAGASV